MHTTTAPGAARAMLRAVAPADAASESRRLHPSAPGPAPVRTGARLLVNGVPEHRALLTRVARRWRPLRLLVAGGGRDGLRLASERRLQLVMVDAQLPDMDATAVVTSLCAGTGPPVIVLGHEPSPREHARFVWAGASAYLARPLDLAQLDRTVRRLVPDAARR
ncbi:MAG TPA: response regulator [Acidimicrobiales bacterium]|nr:response regulator [Acidimicrobiales bacterium]